MSLKGYFIDCHEDCFPQNFGSVSGVNKKKYFTVY